MTSEQEVPACVCPGATTFTGQHVRARMHLRMASLTLKARSGLRAIGCSLAQLLALSGLPIVAVSGLQNVRLVPRRALSGPTSPCLLWGVCFKGVLSHGRRSWGRVLRAPAYLRSDTCRTRRILKNGDPISGGDCERLPRLPSTAKGQGRLQCNGPGIEVQLSVSMQWNSKTHVRKVQHRVSVQSGCSDTCWMTSAPRGMPTR